MSRTRWLAGCGVKVSLGIHVLIINVDATEWTFAWRKAECATRPELERSVGARQWTDWKPNRSSDR